MIYIYICLLYPLSVQDFWTINSILWIYPPKKKENVIVPNKGMSLNKSALSLFGLVSWFNLLYIWWPPIVAASGCVSLYFFGGTLSQPEESGPIQWEGFFIHLSHRVQSDRWGWRDEGWCPDYSKYHRPVLVERKYLWSEFGCFVEISVAPVGHNSCFGGEAVSQRWLLVTKRTL